MDTQSVHERPSSLFEILITQREDLIQSWMKRVRDDDRIPSSDALTSALLRDHFPQLLNQIVVVLAKEKSGWMDPTEAAETVGTSTAAQEHVNMRFLSGYTLLETLRELGHLRTEIITRWAKSGYIPALDELRVLHESFDEVMAIAADEIHLRTSAAKDLFQARLSHELSTPATALVGCADTLRNEPKESEKFQRCLEVYARNSELLVATVENLRDLSEIIFGRMRLALRDCDANEIAKLAAETIHSSGVEKHVEITLRLEPVGRVFSADPVKLHQALLNVMNNAIKYTPSGGSIDLSVHSEDSIVEFTVKDNGEGISQDFLPHVFDQFRQENDTNRTRGLGLGLAITREIVESHGGRITAKSAGKGQGSTFTITLPIRELSH